MGDIQGKQEVTSPVDDSRYSVEFMVTKIEKPTIRLLLLGKTGDGKSATGNSILGTKKFASHAGSSSLTKGIETGYCEHEDCKIKVVDGPGTGDRRLDIEDAVDKTTEDLTQAMAECTEGFNAIIMVYKFGHRYSVEDRDSIDFLKRLLGETVFQMHGICVVTCGDIFKEAMEDEDTPEVTFKEWCEKQKKLTKDDHKFTFTSLLNECKQRVVLFDNRTRDKCRQKEQVTNLLETIKSLPSNELYTSREFDEMREERQKLINEFQLPQMEESIQEKIGLIHDELAKFDEKSPDAVSRIFALKIKGQDLIKEIKDKDRDRGVLVELNEIISGILLLIEKFEMDLNASPNRSMSDEQKKALLEDLNKEKQKFTTTVSDLNIEGKKDSSWKNLLRGTFSKLASKIKNKTSHP